MTEWEGGAKLVGALVPLVWVGIVAYVVWLLRATLPGIVNRLSGFEALGLKLNLAANQAMSSAVELAQKHKEWQVAIPQADQRRAIERAQAQIKLLQGAEVLWVDDRPSNNRGEVRMLNAFGVAVTTAATTDEAFAALGLAAEQARPFHLILSDIGRDLPQHDPKGGIAMLHRLEAEKIKIPLIFYVGRVDPGAPPPAGAFGITNRPDQLLQLMLDALARVRGPA